jgi:hypothetical protein
MSMSTKTTQVTSAAAQHSCALQSGWRCNMSAQGDVCVQGTCLQAGSALPTLPMWLTAQGLQVRGCGISRPLHSHLHCPRVAAHHQLLARCLTGKQTDAGEVGTVQVLRLPWARAPYTPRPHHAQGSGKHSVTAMRKWHGSVPAVQQVCCSTHQRLLKTTRDCAGSHVVRWLLQYCLSTRDSCCLPTCCST